MKKQDLERIIEAEKRIAEIAKEFGLLHTETIFEIVPAQRVLEGMAYMFPTNFSHWSFGRDYEKYRTIYEHTGQGIPYEQVWNFDVPRALLVETNPLALNILVIAHVFGHVDYFLGNRYLKHGRSFSNVSEEARNAAGRFTEYEAKYGKDCEKIVDAGMSIMWHQNPDPFFEEQDEESTRERLIEFERAKLESTGKFYSDFKKPETTEEIKRIERKLSLLHYRTPPEPTHDILNYIIKKSPKPLRSWEIDVLTVIRNQARCLAPNMRTKMLNEGWSTYWHVRIMRRPFEEGFLTPEEHGIFDKFHSGVTRESKSFNWYRIGLAIFEYIKDRWDKGQFGSEYDQSSDPFKRARWSTKANKGDEKIFEVRSFYSDRMAVEQFFTDEFIREQEIYLYTSMKDKDGSIVDVIAEDDPAVIRQLLKNSMSSHGPQIVVQDGNYQGKGYLYLKHIFTGYELDPQYKAATMKNINYLWGRKVFIKCMEGGNEKEFEFSSDRKKR